MPRKPKEQKRQLPTREELLAILASGNEPPIVQPASELDELASENMP